MRLVCSDEGPNTMTAVNRAPVLSIPPPDGVSGARLERNLQRIEVMELPATSRPLLSLEFRW